MDRNDWTRTSDLVSDEENHLSHEMPPEPPVRRHGSKTWISVLAVALIALVIFGAAFVLGMRHRQAAREALEAAVQDSARTPVGVIHPQAGNRTLSVTFPANLQGFTETPIYARTNGYIKRWYADIGAHVQAGQLLAEIETPELDQQLRQAMAAQAQAQANLDLARITAKRYQDLLKYDGVSKQEVDQANGTLAADEAALKAAMANVDQLKELQSFEKVTAPFAGTITSRNIDIGTLVQAGTSTLLFRLAQTSMLRVYANVPEAYSPDIAPGVSADVEVPAAPGQKFPGKVVRTAGAIDPASRTLLTEVHVPNPREVLVPGAFGEVTFHLRSSRPTTVIPANTLIFRSQGPQVALVQDGKVHLQSVQLGRDYGNTLEVISGLTPRDTVIINPSDSITEGTPVDVQPGPSQQTGESGN